MKLSAALLAALVLLSSPAARAEMPATPAPAAAAPATSPAGSADISTPPADDTTDAPVAPGPRIYLVTRIKLAGTDLTQAVFFQHPAMATLEDCEAERARGLMNQWNYFGRYYLKTLKGVSYKVDYRCVEGDMRLAYWRRDVPNSISYLVRTVDGKLKLSRHQNFFACRDALRAVAKEEGVDNFCAVSSQDILPDLPVEN